MLLALASNSLKLFLTFLNDLNKYLSEIYEKKSS